MFFQFEIFLWKSSFHTPYEVHSDTQVGGEESQTITLIYTWVVFNSIDKLNGWKFKKVKF